MLTLLLLVYGYTGKRCVQMPALPGFGHFYDKRKLLQPFDFLLFPWAKNFYGVVILVFLCIYSQARNEVLLPFAFCPSDHKTCTLVNRSEFISQEIDSPFVHNQVYNDNDDSCELHELFRNLKKRGEYELVNAR